MEHFEIERKFLIKRPSEEELEKIGYVSKTSIIQTYLNKKDDEIAFKNEQIRHHYEAMDDKDKLISELYTRIFDLQNMIIEMQKNK